MNDKQTKDMITYIYDTLMKNTNYSQLEINRIDDQTLDLDSNQIFFNFNEYDGSNSMYVISINKIDNRK